jgi:hypothetical protein
MNWKGFWNQTVAAELVRSRYLSGQPRKTKKNLRIADVLAEVGSKRFLNALSFAVLWIRTSSFSH